MKILRSILMLFLGTFIFSCFWFVIMILLMILGVVDFSFLSIVWIVVSFVGIGITGYIVEKDAEKDIPSNKCKYCGGDLKPRKEPLICTPPQYVYDCQKCGQIEVLN